MIHAAGAEEEKVSEEGNSSCKQCYGSRIRDPVPFDSWIWDPGWVKNLDPDSGTFQIIFPRA